jgi:hypothetical protein
MPKNTVLEERRALAHGQRTKDRSKRIKEAAIACGSSPLLCLFYSSSRSLSGSKAPGWFWSVSSAPPPAVIE